MILVDAPRSIDFRTMTNPVRQIMRKIMPRRRLIPPDLENEEEEDSKVSQFRILEPHGMIDTSPFTLT
jgi:hypothetical protein